MSNDPHQWLEEVESERALAWAHDRNSETLAEFTADSRFEPLRARLLAALDSDARIPYVRQRGSHVTNFWRDAAHPRGIWRRTTFEAYADGNPDWEVLLDLDALADEEGENWVLGGIESLPFDHDRVLVLLSRGGADAVEVREFDLQMRAFVAGGFALPEAKVRLAWVDRDTLLVGTDFGPGSLTDSGYPRLIKRWRRDRPLDTAETLLEGEVGDVAVGAWHEPGAERDRTFVYRRVTFFSEVVYVVEDDELVLLDKPSSATLSVHGDWALLDLREDWEPGSRRLSGGSLVVQRIDRWLAGGTDWEVLFAPTPSSSLSSFVTTRSHVVLNVLDDVKHRLFVVTHGADGWTQRPLLDDVELSLESVEVAAVDRRLSDALWVYRSGFTTPSTLGHLDLPDGKERVLRRLPSVYDATGVEVSQHFATSKDGTRVPYFQVGRPDPARTGHAPTLMLGYGGFEVALTPSYDAKTGIAWIERGGIYVVGNVRGGGEYGPDWHRAALQQHRHRAYEDFEAIGRDLVARGVTQPARLGIRGGSNGGLLVGNAYVRTPELWGAVVCQVPLLDMKRYTKLLAGASWAEEYGDPDDPEQWAWLRTFSPYHLLEDDRRTYPPLLLTTSTRDDRVHPGHARKFKAALDAIGRSDVWYYENVEGGHGGAANNEQTAMLGALTHVFLWRMLSPESA